MSKLTKKIVVGLVAFSLAFTAFGFVAIAEEDLQGEIDSLEQALADIMAEMEAMTGGSEGDDEEEETTTTQISGVPADFSFNENLSQGATGSDVKYLQIVLNTDEDTRVAATGAGSPGNETEYFGPATSAAVVKFQNKYASEVLAPVGLSTGTGYVGAQTRAKLNSILDAGEVVSPQPGGNDFSEILDQLAVIAAAVEELAGRVNDLESGVTPEGDEGELAVEARATIRSVEISANETDNVAVFRLEADNSPIIIQRMDVHFGDDSSLDATGIDATTLRDVLDNMALYVDGEKVAEKELTRATVEREDDYIRFSGLNIEVAEDGYKDVTVQVTGADTDDNKTIYVGFLADAVRGVDGVGLTVYNGSSASRSFDFVGEETGSIEARKHSDNPDEGIAMVSDTTSTEVELLRFNFTAKDSDIELDALTINLTGTGVTAAQDLVLYDGSTEIASVTAASGDNDFTTLDLDLNKGTTKTFRVVADVSSMEVDDTYHGKYIMASLAEGDNGDIGYDYLDNSVGIDRTITGNAQALYTVAPYATLQSASNVVTGDAGSQQAAAELVIRVTALGGDVYMSQPNTVPITVTDQSASAATGWDTLFDYADLDTETVTGDYTLTDAAGSVTTGSFSSQAMYKVSLDDTKEIVIQGVTSNADWMKLEISDITWYAEIDGEYYGYVFDNDMDDVDDLETESRYVNN